MEMMVNNKTAEAATKYELMSDGIVAEVEDKLFMIFTYGRIPDTILQTFMRAG